jgi:hypothetical protein
MNAAEQLKTARADDEKDYRKAVLQYEVQHAECERQKELARRVLAKDVDAYREVLRQTEPSPAWRDLRG